MFRPLTALAVLLVAGLSGTAALAAPQFEINPKVNLKALAASGEPVAVSTSSDGVFVADASAVIKADYNVLRNAAFDFDHYVEMGMPYLHASKTVGSGGPGVTFIWNWMTLSIGFFNETSKHCFKVGFHPELGDYDSGSEWQLHKCPNGAIHKLPENLRDEFDDDPAFDEGGLSGSWYMKTLFEYSTVEEPRIYVRYVLKADPSNSFAGLISGAIKGRLEEGAKGVIRILARKAAPQQ